jgi:MFS superfamily sulfate permease-like transporter
MMRDYQFSWLPKDLAAGITLGMVMIPVGLAFGVLRPDHDMSTRLQAGLHYPWRL